MQLILQIIAALLPYLTKYLSTSNIDLIEAISNAVGVLWTSFRSGKVVTQQIQVVLVQVDNVATAIAQQSGVDPATEEEMQEIISIVQNGLAGLQAAEAGADPALLDVPPSVV